MKTILQRLLGDEKSSVPIPLLLLGIVLIIITGWYFTRDLYQSMDILFWDEANYMKSGQMMLDKFNKQWGPSYAVWYKFLSFFENDSLKLYFLNYRLMTILPCLSLFVLLAISNIRLWISFSIALLFLFADINLPVWPKVSHFCVFVFLTGLVVIRYIPGAVLKLGIMSWVALLIAYARPEFYLTYLGVLTLWLIAVLVSESSKNRVLLVSSAFLIILSFGIQKIMGNPLFNFQGDRSALAFAQHFMFNYFQWNNIDQDFWITWMPYYHELFGDATSVKSAYQSNPELFQRHFLSNIQNYIQNGFKLYSDAMLPDKLVGLPIKARAAVLVLGGAIMMTVLTRSRYTSTVISGIRQNMLVICLLVLFVLPSLAACLIIYPREHYMVLHYTLVIFIVSLLFFSKPSDAQPVNRHSWGLSVLFLLFVWIFMPSTKDYHFFDLWRKESSQANLKAVEKLKAYNFQVPVRLLENEGGMNIFLGENYTWIRGFMKTVPWTEYIKNEHVDIIYVTPSLEKYPTLASDSTWYDFKAHPDKYDFSVIKTGNHYPYLLINKNLLKSIEQ